MERIKKMGGFKKWKILARRLSPAAVLKRKIVSLAVMLSLVAFSFVPMATSAPAQNDAAGTWEDSFSDDTGIDLTKSSGINVSGGNITFDDAGWTRDDPWGIEIVDSGVGNNSSDVSSLAIEVDSNNIPYITYLDINDQDFKLAYWDNNIRDWVRNVVPGCSSAGSEGMIDMAIDSNNNVHIACSASQNSHRTYYNRWNGSGWDGQAQLGLPGRRPSHSLSIAVDLGNVPHVAFNLQWNPGLLYYTKSPAWALEEVDLFPAGGSTNCSIAINSSDVPYIVYDDSYGEGSGSNKADVRYAVKNGAVWITGIIKDSANSKGFWTHVAIDIDPDDRIWVIYTDWSNWFSNTIYQYLSIDGGNIWLGRGISSSLGCYSKSNNFLSSSNSELGMVHKDGSNDTIKFGVRTLSNDERDPWNFMSIDSAQSLETAIASGDDGSFHIAYDTFDGPFFTPTETYIKYAGRPLRGTVISKEITPSMIENWDTFSASDTGSVAYSILDGSDLSVIKKNVTN